MMPLHHPLFDEKRKEWWQFRFVILKGLHQFTIKVVQCSVIMFIGVRYKVLLIITSCQWGSPPPREAWCLKIFARGCELRESAGTRGVSTNDQLSEPVTITIMRPGVMDLIYQFLVGGNFLSFGVSNTNCQSTKQSLWPGPRAVVY